MDYPQRQNLKRKYRRRRAILRFCIVLIILALVIIFACLILYKITSTEREPQYKYYSMSEEASARAFVWLNQIDDMPLTYSDVKDMMGDIRLKVVLTPSGEKGKYIQTIAEGSYADCVNKANRGLENAYRAVLKHRITAAGYEGDVTDEMLNDMMKEAYGLSVPGYISYCKIELLPTEDELNAEYSKEVEDE